MRDGPATRQPRCSYALRAPSASVRIAARVASGSLSHISASRARSAGRSECATYAQHGASPETSPGCPSGVPICPLFRQLTRCSSAGCAWSVPRMSLRCPRAVAGSNPVGVRGRPVPISRRFFLLRRKALSPAAPPLDSTQLLAIMVASVGRRQCLPKMRRTGATWRRIRS